MKLSKGAEVTLYENLDQMDISNQDIARCLELVELADHKGEVYKLLLPVIGETNARWISLIV
jgi:hypothetical protein